MFHLCCPDAYCKCVLFGCCICFTHTLHVFYLDVVYDCNGFQVFSDVFFSNVSEACFKYFIGLHMYVATVVFGYFKSRSGVASLLPTFCCIVSLGADRVSIRHRGQVLLNRRRHAPFVTPSVLCPKQTTKSCHEHHVYVIISWPCAIANPSQWCPSEASKPSQE